MKMKFERMSFSEAPFNIIDGDRGKNYPKHANFFDSGYCLFLNAGNVTPQGFSFETCQFITEEKDSALRKGKLQREDVVLTTRGTIGNTAYYTERIPYDNIRINSGMVIFRCKTEKILPHFLYHYLRSQQFHDQVNSLRSGVAQPQLPIRDINRILLPVPLMSTQSAITRVLSAYDDLIENNLRRIKLLEQAARELYNEWFVRFRFPGHQHIRIQNGIPEGWEKRGLKEICPDYRDSANPKDIKPEMPYIGLEHMPRRSITLSNWGHVGQVTSTKLRYYEGDILFGKIRPYFHKVGIALTDGVTSSDAIVLRPVSNKLRCFVLLTVSSNWFVAEVSQTVKEGSKMPRADWKLMQNREITVPPCVLLEDFNSHIAPLLNQLKTLTLSSQKLREARDLLLPKLMNGDIEV
jgi:type I restriction enzyme S subunit